MNIFFAFWSPLYSPGFKSSRLEGYLDECDKRAGLSIVYAGLPTQSDNYPSRKHACLKKYISSTKIRAVSGILNRVMTPVGLSSVNRYVGIYLLSRKIIKSGELNNIDILFCQPYFWTLIKEAKKRGLPIILESDTAYPTQVWNIIRQREKLNNVSRLNADPWNYYPYVRNALFSISAADKIVVFSDHAEQTYLEAGVEKERLVKLRPPLTSPMKVSNSLPAEPKFVFAANHSVRKGLDLVLGAWNQYTKNGGSGILYISGDESPAFKKIWNKFGQIDRVIRLGNVSLHKLFSQERCVLISPSFSEGRPRTVLEAMGAGCPVMASFESSADLVDKDNGWLVELNKKSIIFSLQAIESVWGQKIIDKGNLAQNQIVKEAGSGTYYPSVVKLLINASR